MATNIGGALTAQGSEVKAFTAAKTIFVIALLLVGLFIVYKIYKGFSSVADGIAGMGGTSEADKTEIFGSSNFSDAQAWLDPTYGITQIAKSNFKLASNYQKAKSITDTMLNGAAEAIFEAKTGPYLNATEVQSAIASLPTKAAVSLMALRFNTIYGKYLNFSKTGAVIALAVPMAAPALIALQQKGTAVTLKTFLTQHFDVKEMQTLNTIINKKPNL
jgi:hypothetical protein